MITVELTLKLEIDVDEAKERWRDYNRGLDREDRLPWGDIKSILEDPEKYREYVTDGNSYDEPMDFVNWALEQ